MQKLSKIIQSVLKIGTIIVITIGILAVSNQAFTGIGRVGAIVSQSAYDLIENNYKNHIRKSFDVENNTLVPYLVMKKHGKADRPNYDFDPYILEVWDVSDMGHELEPEKAIVRFVIVPKELYDNVLAEKTMFHLYHKGERVLLDNDQHFAIFEIKEKLN